MNWKKTYFLSIIIITLLVGLYFIYYNQEGTVHLSDAIKTYSLETDGFCVLFNEKYAEINDLPSDQLKKDVLAILPDGYNFIDYVYKINDGALSTFHRDVTSSKTIYHTTYPVYTLILYKYDGGLLSVCPGSAKSYPFVWSLIENLVGKSGTVVLFDCDLLHAGSFNNCKKRNVIQYKICHQYDSKKLRHLAGIRQEKHAICELTWFNIMMRKSSYMFELPLNYLFYPFMLKRENSNTFIGLIQSFIPVDFYNNK
jgi:hypothetical protein